MTVSLEAFLAEAEGIGPRLPGGKLLDSLRRFAARHGLGVAWARLEDHPPEPPGLGPVAALFGQDGEVAEGHVVVDTLVDAAELVGTLERQDPPPAGFGLGWLARLAVQDGLRKCSSASSGSIRGLSETCVQGRGKVAEHLVAAGDQGEELAHDGIGGGRSAEASPEMAKGRLPALALDGDRAQVEEHERVVGPLGLEDLSIAMELSLPQHRVGVGP